MGQSNSDLVAKEKQGALKKQMIDSTISKLENPMLP
jgi:hypothetical protein